MNLINFWNILYNLHRFSYPSKNRTIQIVVQTENLPVGIAVDSANHHIYWVIQFGNKLSRCNLDGTNVTVLPTLSEPWVIRLDVSKRYYVWWRNWAKGVIPLLVFPLSLCKIYTFKIIVQNLSLLNIKQYLAWV